MAHPGIELVSRDRSSTYAQAATEGASDARQVADRWHLLKNVGEAIERLFDRHLPVITDALKPADPVPESPVDAVPLTPGFGEQRLGQRETQAALFVFDGALDVNQPMTITFQTVQSTAWDAILRRVERERSLIRSRAARTASTAPSTGSPSSSRAIRVVQLGRPQT